MKTLRIDYNYIIMPFVLLSTVLILFFLREANIIQHEKKYILQIPKEYFNNTPVAIGDKFEKVSKLVSLKQNWFFDEWSGEKKFFDGQYFSETGWYYFDILGNMTSLSLQILNTDSLSKFEFYKKNFHILKKYYGNNFKIYRDKRNLSTLIFEWKVNNEYVVFMEGFDKESENPNDDDSFIRIEFNQENFLSQELRTTNETLQSLGFE